MLYCNCQRGDRMQVEVKIDDHYTEPKVIILTDKMNDEINELIKKISDETPQVILGFQDNIMRILEEEHIIHIYSENGKILAETDDGIYQLRLRLYEVEKRLDPHRFIRISNSEIVNLSKIKEFDLSFVGTICVSLSNGKVTYVSRRYVTKMKRILGI